MRVIFVVGAPKSGTTLLTQKLILKFNLNYINNITARFWEKPSIGIKITKKLYPKDYGRKFIKFKSDFGVTEELFNVHEFGYFWNKWFGSKANVSQKMTIFRKKKFKSKKFVSFLNKEIFNYFKSYFIFKNLQCGLNAKALSGTLDCVFIRIKRKENQIYKSLKKEYIKLNKFSTNSLISLRPSTFPREYKTLKKKNKIIKQIRDINLDLDKELKDLKVINVKFDDLINDENILFKKIKKSLSFYNFKFK